MRNKVNCKCKVCGKKYVWTIENNAYDKEICSPFCDGLQIGRRQVVGIINNLPENRPLYKDNGLWQICSNDMEDIIFQQGVNESFENFIIRIDKKSL